MKRLVRVCFTVLAILLTAGAAVLADTLPGPVCLLLLQEERVELDDAERELDLAQSNFDAYLEIFGQIESLWEEDVIERMIYLEAKYDRDAAEVTLARAAVGLERQKAVIEQYRLTCEKGADKQALDSAYLRYRETDCEMRDKEAEIAKVNLEYNRELLAGIRDLREGNVVSRTRVILAELRVELEEKRLTWAKRRSTACHRELAEAQPTKDDPAGAP